VSLALLHGWANFINKWPMYSVRMAGELKNIASVIKSWKWVSHARLFLKLTPSPALCVVTTRSHL